MKKTKDSGFTLVELLVSIAVLSIVTLGVGGLLRLAALQYSNATKETEVQNLLQSTVASVSNALEDVAIDVDFTDDELTIINKNGCILFKKAGSTLYYDERSLSDLGLTGSPDNATIRTEALKAETRTATENILADHVETFSVDLTTKAQGFVVLNITIKYNERSKSVIQNVFMRNLRPKTVTTVASNNTSVTPDPNVVTPDPNVVTPDPNVVSPDPNAVTPDSPPSQSMSGTATTPAVNPSTNLLQMSVSIVKEVEGQTAKGVALYIARDENNNYVISGMGSTALEFLAHEQANGNNTIPAMPGLTDTSPNSFTLSDAQLEWLKTYYGIDVVTSMPPVVVSNPDNPTYPHAPENTHLNGMVYQGDLSKTSISMGEWMWGGYTTKLTVNCTDGKPYRMVIHVDGLAEGTLPSFNQVDGGNGRYSGKVLEDGNIEIWYSVTDNAAALDSTIYPIIQLPHGTNLSGVSVSIVSMDVYKE